MDRKLLDYLLQSRFVFADAELEEVEHLFSLEEASRDKAFYYNEFRIANAGRHKKKRPQILTGGIFNLNIPNLHTKNLMEFGDVLFVGLANQQIPYKMAIQCQPNTSFFEVLDKLPPGFLPDFFWDNQIEKDHYIPSGIEMAPFPTVASFCHFYYHLTIENICNLFDRVLPLSKLHAQQLKKKYPEKVIEIPFGLNWASFDFMLRPKYEKKVDVAVTFRPRIDPANKDRRVKVLEMAKAFQKKYGDRFSFVFADDLPLQEYADLLQNSLVVLNVAGAHGPYNYRTIEALCAGCLIFELNWEESFYRNDFNELFQEGVHGVGFTLENFEEKLLYYLTHKEEALHIAKQGLAFLKQNYSYQKLFHQLYNEVKKVEVPKPRPIPNGLGYFYTDMAYYYQARRDLKNMLCYGSIGVHHEPIPWVKALNSMIYFDLPKQYMGGLVATALEINTLLELQTGDELKVLHSLYSRAKALAPLEHHWIIEWNYFLLLTQREKSTKEDFEKVEKLLAKEVEPLPETAIFKYSIDEEDNSRFYNLYFQLGLDLIEKIDQPKARANLFRKYAQEYLKILQLA